MRQEPAHLDRILAEVDPEDRPDARLAYEAYASARAVLRMARGVRRNWRRPIALATAYDQTWGAWRYDAAALASEQKEDLDLLAHRWALLEYMAAGWDKRWSARVGS